ncbi:MULTISPECIES: DUF2614 family zinc ribbon-containing protein [Thermoactinomyces]|jgi:hypothetical protein|uniref:Zinc-ribbon containing domain-containing protein n=1 Tax=Thermoactinomyces daqus TaxID=1329516 RepID=A0A7W2AHP2_9BACL|nr:MULTISPECIES: DUF2614 family zinc ribbon-containing protein [Thermoactinomyces]MBA4543417.1 hypothetical protein [Thermoactinomyces daqus]MBH8599429.1 hypothetical protein [Thermoactinomyces sp. CICC 10523]MBH8605218.1 hypothetical protein [Thermoactinomyces sp. CICC 10522]
MLLSGKLNKIRTFALGLIFAGVGVMYLGFLAKDLIALFLAIGMIFILASVGIYFWIGIISTQSAHIICPACGKQTKVLGKKDECMHCRAILSFDPADAPKQSETPPM